jgi:hypothetical protein
LDETRSVKKIFEGKLEERRGRGRPRLRWINDVEDDLRKLGVKRWRTKALDRVEWTSIIREGKTKLKGPYGYRKKKRKPSVLTIQLLMQGHHPHQFQDYYRCLNVYCQNSATYIQLRLGFYFFFYVYMCYNRFCV